MSKNTPEGNRKRNAAYREKLEQQGMAPIMLRVPETARPLLHRAAALIRDGSDPAEALRVAGGSNEEPLPDREALERLIEQITQERDHYRSQQDRITDAMIDTQQQNSVLIRSLSQARDEIASLRCQQQPRPDAGQGMLKRLLHRWLG
jgi:hypothetical protein